MSTPPLIEASNISHAFKGREVLKDVSLTLEETDFITIIGPNGAGKSTFIKCLLGLIKPNHGIVKKRHDLRIGYIPQKINTATNMPMSVRRFIELNNKKKKNIKHLHEEPLSNELDISSLLDKQLHQLSGGEWQRVLLARTLTHNPHAIILDEPAQNLDISKQIQFYKLLDNIHEQQNIAILMVSHDLHMVMASTRKVVCIYHHICCSGTPQAVARNPSFMQLFGKDMAQMMAIYQHQHDHNHNHD